MIRFVLVVNLAHAFLPTHRHRMSLRNRRRNRQPCTDGGFHTQRRATSSQLFSKSPWRKRLSNILPPISEQETQLTKISDHFRPQFVLQEFLIGVQYMFRVHGWITIGSFLGRNLIYEIFLPLSTNYKWLLQGSSFRPSIYDWPMHLDGFIKRVFYLQLGLDRWMNNNVLSPSPMFEEILYRGIGPMLYQFSIGMSFWCFSWFCRWTMLGAPFLFLGYWVSDLYLTLKTTSWNAMILLYFLGGLVADVLFYVPALIGIWATARKYHRHTNGTHEVIADSGTHMLTSDKASAESGGEPFIRTLVNRIAKVVTGGADDDDTPSSLVPKLERSILMASFWMTSMSFGAAHIPMIPPKDPLRQWLYVNKFFGTFVSSFCIERRLCLRRRSLWSAVGSHVAYNALTPHMLDPILLVHSQSFRNFPVLVRVLQMIFVVLLIQCRQWLCFEVANWLGRVERRQAKTVE
jgi:hypothetical protein